MEIYLVAKYSNGTVLIMEAWSSLEDARRVVNELSVKDGFVDKSRKRSPYQVLATTFKISETEGNEYQT